MPSSERSYRGDDGGVRVEDGDDCGDGSGDNGGKDGERDVCGVWDGDGDYGDGWQQWLGRQR